jgi:hypothetical protein
MAGPPVQSSSELCDPLVVVRVLPRDSGIPFAPSGHIPGLDFAVPE